MTTTTLEQFREQCAKTIELFESASLAWKDHLLDATECAAIIRALPLPVMPEQAEPAKPMMILTLGGIESTSQGLEYSDNDVEWMHGNVEALQERLVKNTNPVALPLFAEDPSALLARVAELEAENAKLKGEK